MTERERATPPSPTAPMAPTAPTGTHEPLRAPAQRAGGVLVVDKPRGPTSHDVVAILRRRLGARQVGHAGTLDPMATGVLVVAIGEATKLLQWLTLDDKAYAATIRLGVETDTLDADGREVRREPPPAAVLSALRGPGSAQASSPIRVAFDRERARVSQVPPVFSAIRTDGERSFSRARRGEAPAMAPRPVLVAALDLVGCRDDPPSVDVSLEASKGYYVRSLARDLAEALGTVGHLTSLRRTRSGCFACDEAAPLDLPGDALWARVQPLAAAAARALPVARVTGAGAREARFGRAVPATEIDAAIVAGVACAWIDPDGALVAVGRLDEDRRGRVLRGFDP